MPDQPKLVLYFTIGCHLCEAAEGLLHAAGLSFQHVDIADEMDLMEQYGLRIPVVQRQDSGAELGWPFDREGLEGFVG